VHIVGKTEDNKEIVAGVFKFYDTYGVPLSFLFDALQENNKVIDIVDFYQFARQAGWKKQRVLSLLSEHLADSYGKDYRNAVLIKLEALE